MTLIDTSAWIEFFRRKGDASVKSRVKDILLNGEAAYTCAIRYVLILGAFPQEIADLNRGLECSRRIIVTPDHWDIASRLGAELRLKGLSFPAIDLLIATVASAEKISLLTCDTHFNTIRDQVLPDLQLD